VKSPDPPTEHLLTDLDIGAFILAFGMQISSQAMQAYVIESYPDHTSSAAAANQFVRSMTAFGFPLFGPSMYSSLGYGWGNSVLALATIVIGLPAPILLWKHGYKLRLRAQSS
jgi:MFS family permease